MPRSVTTDRWGIDDRYLDVAGKEHVLGADARRAILAAMGVGTEDDALCANGPYAEVTVRRGRASTYWTSPVAGDLLLEDGARWIVARDETVCLPFGYHQFVGRGADRPTRLICCPERCYLPQKSRQWGWAAQIYASRSRRSWGIGDLADLRALGKWASRLGADVILVNPLTAPAPVLPIEPSPYYPSSRRFRNPLYIRVEEAPGARELGSGLNAFAISGRALNDHPRIERDAVFAIKLEALGKCFAQFMGSGPSDAFERYRAAQGNGLQQFALYCSIAELIGKDWRQWPVGLRRPDASGVADFAGAHATRVTFHSWLQWILEEQLRQASDETSIIQDLPIGMDAAGADAWCWQDLLAQSVAVGVPPDEYNPAGQNWGLTPFVPHRLRAAGYQPFIDTIRATMRHAGGVRIDHVAGLFRLFWIPQGASAADGGFVRPCADDLLAILALESRRGRAFVVGEDLGTVEDVVREKMATHDILSYRLAYFETGAPPSYPELALATVSTHDLPTIAGLWTHADLAKDRSAGVPQNEPALKALRSKLATMARTPADAESSEVVEGVYRALAAAPSRILLATLEDALTVKERPNLPGAAPDWPNWSHPLPIPIEDLSDTDLPAKIARALSRPPSASVRGE